VDHWIDSPESRCVAGRAHWAEIACDHNDITFAKKHRRQCSFRAFTLDRVDIPIFKQGDCHCAEFCVIFHDQYGSAFVFCLAHIRTPPLRCPNNRADSGLRRGVPSSLGEAESRDPADGWPRAAGFLRAYQLVADGRLPACLNRAKPEPTPKEREPLGGREALIGYCKHGEAYGGSENYRSQSEPHASRFLRL
jgi:hypothetical protein